MANPVFDYSAGKPWIPTPEIEDVIEKELKRDKISSVVESMRDEQVRQLRTDPSYRSQFRAAYDTAGINLTSVTMSGRDSTPFLGRDAVHKDLFRWFGMFDSVNWLHKVTTPEDARLVAERGDVGVILNIQDLGAYINRDISAIDDIYNLGIRIAQLTYNRQNEIGTGCTDRSDGGLSNLGFDAIDRMNDLGLVIDLSHCAISTTLDAIEHSEKPVAFTHTFCERIASHDRAKSDEEMKALAANDGYMGILALRLFLSANTDKKSYDIFFDHLEHAISIMGVDRIGIGSDLSEGEDARYPDELISDERMMEAGWRVEHGIEGQHVFDEVSRYEDLHHLLDGIRDRYTEDEAAKLCGENFLSFWERAT
jgi:membrane dipeptidase